MDENKIQKFQTVIAGLLENVDQKLKTNPQRETENEENVLDMTASKEKENLLEIIDYFANILVKHFYNEPEVNISVRNSKFTVDQLWFFLQCVIEEKRLNRLHEFFSNLEKKLKKMKKKKKKKKNGKDLKGDRENQTGTVTQKEREKDSFTDAGNEMNLKKVPPNSELKQAEKEAKERVKKDATKEVKERALKLDKKKMKQDDPFFSYEEMENFVKEAEDKFYKEHEASPADDEELEDEDEENKEFMDLNEFECNFENEKDLTYNDFFEDIEDRKANEEEGDENEEIDEEDEQQLPNEKEEDEDDTENEDREVEAEEKEEEEDEEEEEEEEEEEDHENDIETVEVWDQEEGRAVGIERALEEESKHNRQRRKKQEMQIENAIKEINEFDDTYYNEESSESANGEIHDKEKIEKELIKKKHWSLTGEVFGYDRPKDSILALDVDIPKVGIFDNNDAVIKSIGKFEEDEEITDDDNEYKGNGDGNGRSGKGDKKQRNHVSMLTEEIELVVKQRIKNMLFDDVERKRIEDLDALTNNENKDEVNFDNLNFSKSKLSLAEEYAKKYENEIKNSQSKNKEMNLQKLEMMNLFKKIMNACDSLSNDYFIPKPVLLNTSECKVATLNIEEAVPIILAQGNKKAPEEFAVKKAIKDPKEMNKRERKALRKLKKEKRKRNLLNTYKESGGINALKERNEYLNEKNKKEKEEKSNIMKYGTASKEDLSASKSKRRFDFNAEMKKAIDYDMKKMEKRSKIE